MSVRMLWDVMGADMLEHAARTWPTSEKIRLYQQQSKQGREYYLALAELYKDDSKKLFETASYLGNLGYAEDAYRLYERADKLDPGNPRTLMNQALVLLDLGEAAKSAAILAKIVEEDPYNAMAHYNLGAVLLLMGDSLNALSHLERALMIEPDLLGARLSLVEAMLNLDQVKECEADLKDLLSENRWIAEAWDLLGTAAAKREDWEQAKEFHTKAVKLDPYRASAHYNLGIAAQGQGKLNEAALAYQAALSIEPNDAETLNNLGLVYAAAGLYELAAEEHKKALEIDPAYAEAAYNLGLAYRALGQNLASAEAFGLALELNPNLKQATQRLNEIGIESAKIETLSPDAGPSN